MNKLIQFLLVTGQEIFSFMQPYLTNQALFSQSLDRQVKVKTVNNIQYNFDLQVDDLVYQKIQEFGLSGRIFSEERGFQNWGEKKYRIVYDPFCNSTLAARTFREAAAGISVFDYDYNFLAAGILDYQTGIMGIAHQRKTKFYQIQSLTELSYSPSFATSLDETWVAVALNKKTERITEVLKRPIWQRPQMLILGSGHIYWLRLALGMIDVYLDPIGGEPLYEMFASTVAQSAGCVVTDLEGRLFSPKKVLQDFEKNPQQGRYYPVAAGTKDLHQEVLTGWREEI